MPRFKCPLQQKMYEKVRALAAKGEMPNRFFGSSAEAYWHGRNGSPKKYLRTSLSYAAFAAGRDARKSLKP